jgi:hypothetical protein
MDLKKIDCAFKLIFLILLVNSSLINCSIRKTKALEDRRFSSCKLYFFLLLFENIRNLFNRISSCGHWINSLLSSIVFGKRSHTNQNAMYIKRQDKNLTNSLWLQSGLCSSKKSEN